MCIRDSSLSPSLSASLCLSRLLSVYPSLSLPLSVSPCLFLPHYFSLSLSVYLCLSLSLSASHHPSLSLSASLGLTLSLSASLCQCPTNFPTARSILLKNSITDTEPCSDQLSTKFDTVRSLSIVVGVVEMDTFLAGTISKLK